MDPWFRKTFHDVSFRHINSFLSHFTSPIAHVLAVQCCFLFSRTPVHAHQLHMARSEWGVGESLYGQSVYTAHLPECCSSSSAKACSLATACDVTIKGSSAWTKCATVFEPQGLLVLVFRKLRSLCLRKMEVSTVGARLSTSTITNDALVPEHSRLFCFTSGIKSYFCCRAAKSMGFLLGMYD